MIKLYSYFRSSTSYRVRIALHFKNLNFETAPVNLRELEQNSDAYARLNKYKTVPVIEIEDGQGGVDHIYQSLAILSWLNRAFPTPNLLPSSPLRKQVCEELYFAIASEIHAPNNLRVLNYLKSEFGADQNALEKWNQTWIERTFAPVEKRLETIDWQSDELPFGAPTFFEIVLIPQIYNAVRWKTDLSPYPHLQKINEYCNQLSAFQKAHPSAQPDSPET